MPLSVRILKKIIFSSNKKLADCIQTLTTVMVLLGGGASGLVHYITGFQPNRHSPTNSLTQKKKSHPHIPAANRVTGWFIAECFYLFFSLGWGRSLIAVLNVSDSEPVPAHVPGIAAKWDSLKAGAMTFDLCRSEPGAILFHCVFYFTDEMMTQHRR